MDTRGATTYVPFARPLYVMLKPVGARCNLACSYCYYLEKGLAATAAPNGSDEATAHRATKMSNAKLEEFTRQYIEAQTMPQVLFTWHGGEPLLLPMDFYRHAMLLQRKYAHGRQIDNCLQTNGTLLTDEWCQFLHDNNFLVGISIDGPQDMHDTYRRDRHRQPSFQAVMRGVALLQKHGVEWNAMAAISSANVERPVEFYRFFKEIGCHYLQFTPVVERFTSRTDRPMLMPGTTEGGRLAHYSITPEQWGTFLCEVYDQWVRNDVGTLFVQTFDATLANWVGAPPGICSLSASCGNAAVMEADGTVYSCDHFVFPQFRLGNIATATVTEMLYGDSQRHFGQMKHEALPRQCHECHFLFACHGECPRNRFVRDRYGQPMMNYLCRGYHRFFCHVAHDMDFMAAELMAGRPPANITKRKE